MKEAMGTHGTYFPTTLNAENKVGLAMKKMAEENAVIVFARKGCCLSYVAKRLLQALGANTAVCDVDDMFEDDVVNVIELRGAVQLPVVFIGGQWFGGLDRIVASHISGELTPLLKWAGALWL